MILNSARASALWAAVLRRLTLDSVHTFTLVTTSREKSTRSARGGSRPLSRWIANPEDHQAIPISVIRLMALTLAQRGRLYLASKCFRMARIRKPNGRLDATHEAHALWVLGDREELRNLLSEMCRRPWFGTRQEVNLRYWAFWHLGHADWNTYLRLLCEALNVENRCMNSLTPRDMPEHTSNQGHQAQLALRAARLAVMEPEVMLRAFTSGSPNSVYLELLAKRFQNLTLMAENDQAASIPSRGCEETLILGKDECTGWQPQASASPISHGDSIELAYFARAPLSSPPLSSQRARDLSELGLRDGWFAVLHVRESINPPEQLRDSRVAKLHDACEWVRAQGGQIVRMGDTTFPRSALPGVLDYAHFPRRSPEIDVWLWAHCRWWMGNANGAAATMLTFRPPRLLFDVWPWDPVSRNSDLWMPTLIRDVRNGKLLRPKEVIGHHLGRVMNPRHLEQNGLEAVRVSPQDLVAAVEEIYDLTESQDSLRALPWDNLPQVQKDFGEALGTWRTNRFVPLTSAYVRKLDLPASYH